MSFEAEASRQYEVRFAEESGQCRVYIYSLEGEEGNVQRKPFTKARRGVCK